MPNDAKTTDLPAAGAYEGGNLNMMLVNKQSEHVNEALGANGF